MTAKKITLKSIDTAIASFVTNRDKLRDLAQSIAAMVVLHAAPAVVSPDANGTGDCTRALSLVKELPKSWQPQMELWFKMFTPIRVNARNERCEYDPEYKKLAPEDKAARWNIAGSNETPFYNCMAEPEPKTLDFDDLIKLLPAMAKRLEKQVSEGRYNPDVVPSVEAAIAKIKAVEIVRVKPAPANEAVEDAAALAAAAAAA